MPPLILDGKGLARERAPELVARAADVTRGRGRPPRLVLVAFADPHGHTPYVARKRAACRAAGVDVAVMVRPAAQRGAGPAHALAGLLAQDPADGVFVQFPIPQHVDADALLAAVPLATDIDVMTPAAVAGYFTDPEADPPLTVSAALELLAAHDVDIEGVDAVVVGPATDFNRMFVEALARRGAWVSPPFALPGSAPDGASGPPGPSAPVELRDLLASAGLVVLSAGVPHAVPAGWLAPGTIVLDASYFNPGGRGDLDAGADATGAGGEAADGIAHLRALAPVPGGLGPMTVSVLVERVIARAAEGS